MTERRFAFVTLTALVLLTAPARAHDTWLQPDHFRLAAAGPVTLALSSGMEFPTLDHAIAPERVASARWQTAQGQGDLPSGTAAPHALEFRAQAGPGVTVFTVALHPRPSSLKREQVPEYVGHLGLPNAKDVLASWEEAGNAEETRYRYFKYAKTFVRSGAAESSGSWAESKGMRLELVPQNDPTSVRAGGTLEVLLLDGGTPKGNYPISLLREGTKEVSSAVTGADGRARLTLPSPGRYMLRATTLEPSADPGSRWDVHFTTMTLQAEATD